MEELPFWLFVGVGFLAQIIDGGLGMGFGIFSNTILLGLGSTPIKASTAVHTAEIFTSGSSAFFHWRQKNIDPVLFKNLTIFGVLGGCTGAYALARISGEMIKPIIACYLLVLGIFILHKTFKKIREEEVLNRFFRIGVIGRSVIRTLKFLNGEPNFPPTFTRVLGLFGGFLDAIGGGGWGPMVTSTLVVKNPEKVRFAVGTSCAAEFFVTLSTSLTFWLSLSIFSGWKVVLGLLIGGVIASPISAIICRKIPPRILLFSVGFLMIGLSSFTLLKTGTLGIFPNILEQIRYFLDFGNFF